MGALLKMVLSPVGGKKKTPDVASAVEAKLSVGWFRADGATHRFRCQPVRSSPSSWTSARPSSSEWSDTRSLQWGETPGGRGHFPKANDFTHTHSTPRSPLLYIEVFWNFVIIWCIWRNSIYLYTSTMYILIYLIYICVFLYFYSGCQTITTNIFYFLIVINRS